MNEFDAAILNTLQRNARVSWVKLGEEVNLSPSACQRRVQALQEEGVIEGFTVCLNEVALGRSVKAFVEVSVDRQDPRLASEFREWVRDHPQVLTCHMVTGSFDYMLEVVAVDLESLGRFLESELLSLSAVKDASSSIMLGKVKTLAVSVCEMPSLG